MLDLATSVYISKVVLLTLLTHVSVARDIFMKQYHSTLGQHKWMCHGCADETEENEQAEVHLDTVAIAPRSFPYDCVS